MQRYTVKLHLHTNMPEARAEAWVATWVEEGRWHLTDGESFRIVSVKTKEVAIKESIREFIVSHSDDELMQIKAAWKHEHREKVRALLEDEREPLGLS